jgi:putative membrane protein insertion efficiency factor
VHVTRIFLALVAFYRRWLSPLKRRPTCRFLPTCSEYAQQALETHGALRGGVLAFWRVCRCSPLSRGGLDPVPPRRSASKLVAPPSGVKEV